MNRRHALLALLALGDTAWSWPLPGQAQTLIKKMPRVGVLWHAGTAKEEGKYFEALHQGFRDLGYVDGRNITIEHRFPAEQYERFQALAAELVQLKVDAIVAVTRPAAIAAQRATATIPVVFLIVPDPVGAKLVESLARPGKNITGYSNIAIDLSAKRLEIFKEAVPSLSRIALLVNPGDPEVARRTIEETEAAAALLKMTVQPVEARGPGELERAFSLIAKSSLAGVVMPLDPMMFNERNRIAKLALTHRLPTMHPNGDTVDAGILMSYGPSHAAIFRRAPIYVDKILKGAQAGNLPVEQPTRFEVTVNLKTAKALGITIPQSVLLRADRVVE